MARFTQIRSLNMTISKSLLVALALYGTRGATAQALDITSYVAATYYSSEASTYKTLMLTAKGEDERRTHQLMWMSAKNKATTFLIAGLALDALVFVILTSASTGAYDRIDELEVEVANGGGPIIDAYAAGFGVPKNVVIADVKHALHAHRSGGTTGATAFDSGLFHRLAWDATLTDDEAARILYALHQERSAVGSGQAPWHQRLATLAEVPIEEIAETVSGPIDARLAAATIHGKVISPRTALAKDASQTMNDLVEHIFEIHQSSIEAQLTSAGVVQREHTAE
jgi:hypothetical protein